MSDRCSSAGQEGAERLADVADEAEADVGATAEMGRLVVDLDDRRVGLEERPIREVRSQHQQQVAIGECLLRAAPAEQAGHADAGRVVVLENVLAAVGVPDRSLEGLGELQHLVARVPGAVAAVDRDALRLADQLGSLVERLLGGPNRGRSVTTACFSSGCSIVAAPTSPEG